MPTAIVLQQVAHEGPGTIADAAGRAGWRLDVRHLYRGDAVPTTPDEADALIVMGGPMNVDEVEAYPFLARERQLLERAIRAQHPVLGFCLGSQLIARAAGAEVFPAGLKEIGWYDVQRTPAGQADPLLARLDDILTVFHWHGDTFSLPPGATLLCRSEPIPHQAFRLGRAVYAFQFHVELTEPMIAEWIELNAAELNTVREHIDPKEILRSAPRLLPSVQRLGAKLLERWFTLAGAPSPEA